MVDERSIPKLIVDALCDGLGDALVAVILYGSRARGTARPDSDWDVLVIAAGLPSRMLERHLLIKRVLPPSIRGLVGILSRTPAEMDAANPLPALYHDIAVDAEVLYDTGFADIWLQSARSDIAARGLRREPTPFGLVWRLRPAVADERP